MSKYLGLLTSHQKNGEKLSSLTLQKHKHKKTKAKKKEKQIQDKRLAKKK